MKPKLKNIESINHWNVATELHRLKGINLYSNKMKGVVTAVFFNIWINIKVRLERLI